MLSRLRIKNFQKHEKVDVEFSPSVTTIVGPSDSGKSALIRAIRWVLFNKPSGTEFIRDGEEKCSVRLETENHTITRIRGKENTYKLDGKTFRAFGNDVPPAIQDVARIGPINFQDQHDPPFWLSESAGQVSRNLNQIVNLGIIDSALSNTASTLKKAKWESEATRKNFNEAKQERSALAWTTEANNELGVIEAGAMSLEGHTEAQNRLFALVVDVEKYTEATKDAKALLSEIESLKKLTEKILDLDNKAEELNNVIESMEIHEAKLQGKTKLQIFFTERLGKFKVCPLCQQQMTT